MNNQDKNAFTTEPKKAKNNPHNVSHDGSFDIETAEHGNFRVSKEAGDNLLFNLFNNAFNPKPKN